MNSVGDFLGYGSIGSAYMRPLNPPVRESVTLEAKVNPESPHEYSVHMTPELFKLQQDHAEAEYSAKKSHQNRDPASQAFLGVADYKPVKHNIDIFV